MNDPNDESATTPSRPALSPAQPPVRASARPSPDGVVIVDKPEGPTSHDVVAKIRRALKTRKVGHAGTLDPMATGVLVVAVGEATKLVPWLTLEDKAYEATIRLGIATDTLDAMGRETEQKPIPPALLDGGLASPLLEAAVAHERARTSQMPPAFSAIRIGGERAHAIARRGEQPALVARDVAVRSLDVLALDQVDGAVFLRVRVDVIKGYFVRALARDLAEALGTVGHLTALRRTQSGPFTIREAVPLDRMAEDALLSLDAAAARALPASRLTAEAVRAARDGKRLDPTHLTDPRPEPSSWFDEEGRLVAIGEVGADGFGRVLRGFRPPAA